MSLEIVAASAPLVAAAAGAAFLPGTFKKGANPEFAPTRLGDEIPWIALQPDGITVRTALGGYFRCLSLRGALLITASEQTKQHLEKRRFEWLMSLQTRPVAFRFLTQKRRLPAQPSGFPLNAEHAGADQKWAQYLSSGFSLTHSLMVSADSSGGIHAVEEATSKFRSLFSDEHAPRALSNEPDATGHSPLAGFLFGLVNHFQMNVAPLEPTEHIADAIAAAHQTPLDDGSFAITIGGKTLYIAVVTIKRYSDLTAPFITDTILSLNCELDYMLHGMPRSKMKTAGMLSWRRQQAKFVSFLSNIDKEFEEAHNDTLSEVDTYMPTECVVFLRAESQEALSQAADDLIMALGKQTVIAVRERELGPRLYAARLPGFEYFTRPRELSAKNIASITQIEGSPTGHKNCMWGAGPARYLATATYRAPYAFNFHPNENDAGSPHTIVFAPTSRGKSVLIAFIIAGALAAYPDLRTVAFDRNRGLHVPTMLAGGSYLYPGRESLELNPFDTADTPANRKQLEEFLSVLAERDDDESLKAISEAVHDAFTILPVNKRRLRDAINSVVKVGPLRQSLEKWTKGDRYGNMFNGRRDAFDPTATRWTTIGMDEVISDSRLAEKLTFYFVSRFETAFVANNIPYLGFVDEGNILLAGDGFARFVEQQLLTARKNRGAFVMAFQTIDALMGLKIASTVIKNCDNVFFWPGAATTAEELKNFPGLTDSQIKFILGHWRPRNSNRPVLLYRRDAESVFLETDLGPLGDHLNLFRGSVRMTTRMEKCRSLYGTDYRSQFLALTDDMVLPGEAEPEAA